MTREQYLAAVSEVMVDHHNGLTTDEECENRLIDLAAGRFDTRC